MTRLPAGEVQHSFRLINTRDPFACDSMKGSKASENKCCHPDMAPRAVLLSLSRPCAQSIADGSAKVALDGAPVAPAEYSANGTTGTLSIFPRSGGAALAGRNGTAMLSLRFPAGSACVAAAPSQPGATPGPCAGDGGCGFNVLITPQPLDGPRASCTSKECASSCCALQGRTLRTSLTSAGASLAATAFPADGCAKPAGMVAGPSGPVPEIDTRDFPVRFAVIGDWGSVATPTPSGLMNTDRRAQLLVAEAMARVSSCQKPQFILNMGDSVYDNGCAGV